MAEVMEPHESRELQFQDMLILFLLPHIQQKLDEVYSSMLTVSPIQYPYFIDLINVERLNGFRSFHFLITLEKTPKVGPHIPVGKDRFTFEISPTLPDNAKLVHFKHLKDPNKEEFPPNYKDLSSGIMRMSCRWYLFFPFLKRSL